MHRANLKASTLQLPNIFMSTSNERLVSYSHFTLSTEETIDFRYTHITAIIVVRAEEKLGGIIKRSLFPGI